MLPLARHFAEIHGVDISEEMIRLARLVGRPRQALQLHFQAPDDLPGRGLKLLFVLPAPAECDPVMSVIARPRVPVLAHPLDEAIFAHGASSQRLFSMRLAAGDTPGAARMQRSLIL